MLYLGYCLMPADIPSSAGDIGQCCWKVRLHNAINVLAILGKQKILKYGYRYSLIVSPAPPLKWTKV